MRHKKKAFPGQAERKVRRFNLTSARPGGHPGLIMEGILARAFPRPSPEAPRARPDIHGAFHKLSRSSPRAFLQSCAKYPPSAAQESHRGSQGLPPTPSETCPRAPSAQELPSSPRNQQCVQHPPPPDRATPTASPQREAGEGRGGRGRALQCCSLRCLQACAQHPPPWG